MQPDDQQQQLREEDLKNRIGPKGRFPITRCSRRQRFDSSKKLARIRPTSKPWINSSNQEKMIKNVIGPKGRFRITRCVRRQGFDSARRNPMTNSSSQEKRIKKRNRPEGPIPNDKICKKTKVSLKQNTCADPTRKQVLDQQQQPREDD